MGEIERRRVETITRIDTLRSHLGEASSLVDGKACVFATGSFGRLEAGPESDLDLCIVGLEIGKPSEARYKSALSNLDAICVRAELIQATRKMSVKDFDGDGKYLAHYSSQELADSLGKDDDDYKNTMTSRLLMLLESKAIIGEDTHIKVIEDVIAKYWRDYADHKTDFTPAFLGNDVLRLWRTFCVNYEARTEREPEEKKIKGKLKNYKLKHSRLATCYSALAYMLHIYGQHRYMSRDHAMEMVRLTPMERLSRIKEENGEHIVKSNIDKLFSLYNDFLISTSNESLLGEKLMDVVEKRKYAETTFEFGDNFFNLMNAVGNGSRLHRLLMV